MTSTSCWSTVAGGPIFAGKRKKVARWLRDDYAPSRGSTAIKADIERRLDRVDEIGSSEARRRIPIWEDKGGGMIYANDATPRLDWLPFANLLAFTLEFKKAQKEATEDGWEFDPSDHLLEDLED